MTLFQSTQNYIPEQISETYKTIVQITKVNEIHRLIPILRGSSPQEGDPLGIYPGGGLDSRLDPALVPAARAQLGDEVRLLRTQLDILTRRLGVTSRRSGDNTLDAGLLL